MVIGQNLKSLLSQILEPRRVESFSLAEVQTDSERFVRDGSGRTWFVRSLCIPERT